MTTKTSFAFSSGLSTLHDFDDAAANVADQIAQSLDNEPDLLFAFVSQHYGPDFDALRQSLLRRTNARLLIGCTGESIVGNDREIEGQPAIAALGAVIRGADISTSYLEFDALADGGSFIGLPEEAVDGWPDGSTMILLGEPFSFPADGLLTRLSGENQCAQIIGGMASGGRRAGENALFLNDRTYDSGAVAVLLGGSIAVDAVVSQGCRPVGRPFVITKAEQNVIFELGGKPPLTQFQEVYDGLDSNEQQLVRQGLHVGRVVNEYQSHFERGDFLVRNVIGADKESGAIAIGDYVRPGQTVQFHIRDAASADEDFRHMLRRFAKGDGNALGGLLFTCNGRGSRLFHERDHDAAAVRRELGAIPTAGFFAQGEIGPVGGKSFLHGFTASLGLFRERATT